MSLGLFNAGRDLFGVGQQEWQYAGDLVDTRFNNIILEHNYQWIIGNNDNGFWNTSFFYPAPNMLAGSDAHISTTPFYFLFRIAGYDMFSSFQLWVFTLFVLNFCCCYYVLRKFKLNRIAASTGAFIFTFSMPVLGQTFHIQTLCKFAVPLVIFYLYKWIKSLYYTDFIRLNIMFVILFFSSLYFTLLCLIPMVFIAAILFYNRIKNNKEQLNVFNKKNIIWHLITPLFSLLLMIPVALIYIKASDHIPPISKEIILNRLPILKQYLICMPGSYWYSNWSLKLQDGINEPWNSYFGFGFFTLLTFIVGVFLFIRKNRLLLLYCLTLLFLLLVFTKFGNTSTYLIIRKFSGFNHLQAPWRFYLVALFFIAGSIAFIFHIAFERFIKYKWLISIIALVIITENLVQTDSMKHTSIKDAQFEHQSISAAIMKAKNNKHKAFVLLSKNEQTLSFDNIISCMVSAYECKIPCINGYTTLGPKGYCIDWIHPTHEQVVNWMRYNKWSDEEIKNGILEITVNN